ncbi:MAG: acyl-CoA dehydrogenase family protein [Chloroflexi bacterium]|nr:acyl-CoA dehydrogenase family protein [Chloroflexota bacterium]
MNFVLTSEQKMLLQTVRDIARRELAPRAAQIDREARFPRDGIQELARAGVMGLMLPPAIGGGGGDSQSFVLATEEIAKACASTALVFVTHAVASLGILIGGQDPLKRKYLPLLAKGEAIAAFAATEPESGGNPAAIQSSAKKHDGYYTVNGSKVFITSGGEADLYLTVVRTGDGPGPMGLSCLAIDKNATGLSMGRKDERMGLNGSSPRELVFEDCRVPQENLVGSEGAYMPLGMVMGGLGALGAAAIALGLSQAALEASIAHGKGRLILKQPIGLYQGVQFLVSEMAATVDAMRAQVGWVAHVRDTTPPPHLDVFKAKLFATEMALEVISKGLQVHGGQGYTKDFPLERFYRDARGLTLHFGPSEMLKETIGKFLMGLMP